ncbi:MAG: 3-deoxy-manno-octulosonate cytidylyltransferase [Chitinophagales bacterium]
MKVLGIIPARYESVRFPGKPLADIAGKSMIQRVYEQANQSKALDKLVVATDDQRIFDHVASFGGSVVMTSKQCKNGTERCAEVLLKENKSYDAVINIQGDEPILNPEQISQLVELLNSTSDIATLAHKLAEKEKANPNIVKVALGGDQLSIAFSRDYDFIQNQSDKIYKHIGLYGFKSSILKKIVKLQPTPNEELEKLEQLRWVDHGYQIKVGITSHQNFSVDVPDDIIKILKVLNS